MATIFSKTLLVIALDLDSLLVDWPPTCPAEGALRCLPIAAKVARAASKALEAVKSTLPTSTETLIQCRPQD